MKVKFCGLTRLDDAKNAVHLGVDALGFVFYAKSPRFIEPLKAKTIIESLPPFVSSVGLVVNHSREEVEAIINSVPVDILQFHGDESGDFCESFGFPYIKALSVTESIDMSQLLNEYPSAKAFLLDAPHSGDFGGTGHTFDWGLFPKLDEGCLEGRAIILAGGLSVDNIQEAVTECQPYAVDLSSGIESDKGIKDLSKMRLFMNKLKQL